MKFGSYLLLLETHRHSYKQKEMCGPQICDYVHKPDGWRCQTVPRDGLRCSLHRGRASAVKCRFFEKCGRWFDGGRGVCAPCQRTRWRLLRKEKEMDLYAEELLKSLEIE